MLKIPFGTERASESMVKFLLSIGALYTDETGIHASEPGIYGREGTEKWKEEFQH